MRMWTLGFARVRKLSRLFSFAAFVGIAELLVVPSVLPEQAGETLRCGHDEGRG